MKKRSNQCRLALMALVIGGLLLVLLLQACSDSSPSPAASPTAAGPAKPTGSLVIQASFSTGGVPDPLITGNDNVFQTTLAGIFDSLVERNPQGQSIPGLAERWEIAPDGLSHTFYIRKGVKFHNGDDLTGADVKFSIERLIDPKGNNAAVGAWRAAVAGVDLKDDYTVVLRMKTPQFDFLYAVESQGGVTAVMPKKYFETNGADYFNRNPVGSGPWKVLSFQPGVRIELEANENHWRRVVPQFKNITLLNVDEEASKVAMLKTGELDMAMVASDSVAGLKSAGLRTIASGGINQYVVYMFYDIANPSQYKLGDIRVRKALSLGINRQEMVDQLLGGFGDPLVVYNANPTANFWDPTQLKADPYDPESAKKLLADAGLPNGFNLKLWSAGIQSENLLNQAVIGYWNRIGVKGELVAKDKAPLQAMYYPKVVPDIYDSVVSGSGSAGGVQFEKIASTYSSKTGPIKMMNNPPLDALIDKIATMPPSDDKKKLQLQAAIQVKNDYIFLPGVSIKQILAMGQKVGGITPVAGMTGIAYSLVTITHPK